MGLTEHKILQNLANEFTKFQSFKKIVQLLVSVSLFSFLCSYLTFYSFLYSIFKSNFWVIPFQITSKNFVFFIFNGILVFLAKTSGFLRSWSGYYDSEEPKMIKKITEVLQMKTEKKQEVFVDIYEDLSHKEKDKEVQVRGSPEIPFVEVDKTESENGVYSIEDNDEKQEENEYEFEEEDDEGIGMLSTEELNKKFDDFITRMKEEIRIEATQTLNMV